MNNDDFFNFLVATDTLDDFLGYKDPNNKNNNSDDIEDIKETDEEETTENDDVEEMD